MTIFEAYGLGFAISFVGVLLVTEAIKFGRGQRQIARQIDDLVVARGLEDLRFKGWGIFPEGYVPPPPPPLGPLRVPCSHCGTPRRAEARCQSCGAP